MIVQKKLTFIDHLEELRNRILKSAGCILIFTLIAFAYSKQLLSLIISPIGKVVFISPEEAFVSNLMVAFWCGLSISFPFILFEIWKFISSGLTDAETKYARIYFPVSFLLFLIGACFGYFIIVPIGLKFLLGFGSKTLVPMITASKYIAFVGTISLSFGLVFQLPVIIVLLTKIGIVSPKFLQEKRKYSIVLIFILSAIFTPQDIATQFLMALPLVLLYEIGIICSKISKKNS